MTENQPTRTLPAQGAAESTPLTSAATSGCGQSSVTPEEGSFPRAFGRYELRRLLGKGGMGRVYLAYDPMLAREVALKMPNPVEGVAGWRDRFLTEARAAATLTHPHVCPVHDVGEVDGQPYLTMAYIEGETLAATLQREGAFSPARAAELVRTVARAIQEAHRRGIIHRDLKPANIMIAPDGRPVLMDFGLAIRAETNDDLRLTLTGVALGTPAYMPPEQAGGDHAAIGPATDVYALGVILYELVTGRTPFQGRSFGKLLAQIERDPPPPPSSLNPEVDRALEVIILTALAKLPADRFASTADFADALDRYQQGDRQGITTLYDKPYALPVLTTEYRPGDIRLPTSRPPVRRRVGWFAGTALVLMLATMAAAAVIYIQTDYGELEIRLSDPNAKVDVRVNGKDVSLDPGDGKLIRVRAGRNQKLEVSGPDYETIAETFDVKRNGVTIVQLALVRREKPPGGEGPGIPPPPVGEVKPVAYPKAPTLIEFPGWQILTDATRDEMQTWLAERKKEKQSVLWLDAYPVGSKPVFCAVAALDNRTPNWSAFLDITPAEINDVELLAKRPGIVNIGQTVLLSLSGFATKKEFECALLVKPGATTSLVGVTTLSNLKRNLTKLAPDGFVARLIRPFPLDRDQLRFAAYLETTRSKRSLHELDLTEKELTDQLEKYRKEGYRPLIVAAYASEGKQKFAVTFKEDPARAIWEVHRNLTARDFKTAALSLAEKGFTPTCVTATTHEGAVRYCVVWVKEPPKPVAFPKSSTLIETPGWQILTDATRDEMQKWLDERKKAKHSVLWLDATQVEEKPLFTAVAMLDDRHPNWRAFLDLSFESYSNGELLKEIGLKTDHPLSISGYAEGKKGKSVSLWRHDPLPFFAQPDSSLAGIREVDDQLREANGVIRSLRPCSIAGGIVVGIVGHRAYGEKTTYLVDATPEKLSEFVKARQEAGERITSLAGYVRDGQLLFAIVGATNPEKGTWKVDSSLTVEQLKEKAAEMARLGFFPQCTTAYPWDSAVRYCVVWVKEPPKPIAFPKSSTLIETAGWQILTDASKDEMQTWLDERKKAKHSVLWLDASIVAGKPVFCALAALDNRDPEWMAFLDMTAEDFGKGMLAKKASYKTHVFRSISGYTYRGVATCALLTTKTSKRWYMIPDCAEAYMPEWLQICSKSGLAVRILRPYPCTPEAILISGYADEQRDDPGSHILNLTTEGLAEELQKARAADKMPNSVAGYLPGTDLRFSATFGSNPLKKEWLVESKLSSGELKKRAVELRAKGFQPKTITSYPWEGAVRYSVVWIKDASRPEQKKPGS